MEKIQWKVEGMDCNTCALSIHKYLEKQGMKNVKVNFATGDVIFESGVSIPERKITEGLSALGYQVVAGDGQVQESAPARKKFLSSHLHRFLFCLPFTALLMLPMIPAFHFHWLMDPLLQLGLTIPVYIVGMRFFGRSAWKSIRNGMPNMNVLIAMGATASFLYSLYGYLEGLGDQYMFYETAAAIITLVFLGNYLEEASVTSTQRELNKLARSQEVMANMIVFDDKYKEHLLPVDNQKLRVGDLILIRSGEQVPIDCKILWGEADADESIITGESLPVHKLARDKLIGGSLLRDGTVKAQVTAAAGDTILSGIINMVKQAQGEKPPVQVLADRISAIFIPIVLGLAALTLLINGLLLHDFTAALMRSIAVLVIACPCAMGLATPAAIAVGLGRAARKGILFRNASSLEIFRDIRQVVFDKTGTLTTGKFRISAFKILDPAISPEDFKRITVSLEKYSTHPIARSILSEWKPGDEIAWKKLEEIKGVGIRAEDEEGNRFSAGSFKILPGFAQSQKENDQGDPADREMHNVYLLKNEQLLGWIDVKDEIRPEAKGVIAYLHSRNINSVLLSGDRLANCEWLARELGIDTVIAEQSPQQKLEKIAALNAVVPTAMVGDGINDAPALAKASLGISLDDASRIAMQSAQVLLMNQGLKKLPLALGLGRHTYITIKQNLFWAFAYNVVAIPVAAVGLLTPTVGALAMGLSDVVLALNSIRLFVKKVE